jgi:hypothetical protein
MNCAECGNPVGRDAKFCPKCYARIEPPGLLRRFALFFENQFKPGPTILRTGPRANPVSWRGKAVQVRASPVPRFLWMSASIDVYLDGECVFRTGGKIQSAGSHRATARIGGSEHQIEVTWGRPHNLVFPYQLRIDGERVTESQVEVENQQMMLIPLFIIFGVMILIAVVVNQLLKIVWPHLNGG